MGRLEDVDKQSFLAELASIKPSILTLWIVMGDFNLIYEARDKNNLNLNRRLMGQFRRTLDDYELLEFALQNSRYTWSNERVESTLIRLDRVLQQRVGLKIFMVHVASSVFLAIRSLPVVDVSTDQTKMTAKVSLLKILDQSTRVHEVPARCMA
jgi:hypothetical protein